MIITFSVEENSKSSSDFIQANFELSYQRQMGNGNYVKRFSGQLPLNLGIEIGEFLEANSENYFQISVSNEQENLVSVNNCKLVFVITDVVNNFIRIELRKDEGF